MAQQTAVEWFNDEIIAYLNFDQRLYLKNIFKKAKQMEKEQIKEAYKSAGECVWDSDKIAEQYYNETYGKE